jgi:LSD1 subclass zinc finger protein
VDGEAILLSRLASRTVQNHSCRRKLGYTKGGYLYAEVRCSYHLGKILWSSASLTAHHRLHAVRWFLRALSRAARTSLACLLLARPWPASRVFSQSPPVCSLECNEEVWRCLHHAVPPLHSIRSSFPNHLQYFARAHSMLTQCGRVAF